ncbi:MAG: YabP/YqfC family sporulation protein, partial [Clostridia bacterium]|nr:YabP/YqfC family sporulation protein [Clostridia bacterium]
VYQEDEVALQTAAGLLKLHGKNLSFAMYTAGEALITGQIDAISLCGGLN